jgi:Nif-specific regulatory protein
MAMSSTLKSGSAAETHGEDFATFAADCFSAACLAGDTATFLPRALPLVQRALGADFVALTVSVSGHWKTLDRCGTARTLPTSLLPDALDTDAPRSDGNWLAASLQGHTHSPEVVAAHFNSAAPPNSSKTSRVIATLGQSLVAVRQRQHERSRIARLEAILQIAAQWNQTNEMEPLLTQMAQAATKLLSADRASIFLWDRPNHVLVGRPALGLPDSELRIPDTTGVVGHVVQTGQPRRVDAEIDSHEIARAVDKQTGYQTLTILCVPLRGSRGELFGAFEVINKRDGNFTAEDEEALTELASHAAIALENTQQLTELLATHRRIIEQAAQGVRLIGKCPAIAALQSTAGRVAATELAILILGENGTGKEVVSQLIHYMSPRRDKPFIAVNCAAITETLLESELFGHEKGAFTDAHEARAGKFELATGGTLFLDEIGDLSPAGQAKLLRVLEEKIVIRVGGSKPIHTDVRVIAATNQNLADMVRQKRFRQDLYFRLNVVTLELPPLRDRGDDVIMLAEHFMNDFCHKAHRKPVTFSPAAVARLCAHSWPGNVRELRNLMERLAYLLPGDRVDVDDLALMVMGGGEQPPLVALDQTLSAATDQFQMDYIKRAIERAKSNMSLAAEKLGLHRSNLYRKMRQLGMPTGE